MNKNKLMCGAVMIAALMLSCVASLSGAEAKSNRPLLHPLFCDHAVLQRDARVPIWGWTEPGATVTVTFGGQSQSATAGKDGKWMVRLKRMRASAEPRTMTVKSSAGTSTTEVKDVLVGDVWLCSGQSNMEMGVGLCDVPNDIASADFPLLRLLTVPKRTALAPQELLDCHWSACTPETIMEGSWGGFSATAFYFGRKLQRDLNIPIGLIHSSWGGTIAEAWTSAEGLEPLGDFDDSIKWVGDMAVQIGKFGYDAAYENWCLAQDPGTQGKWQMSDQPDAAWRSAQMPQPFERIGLRNHDGIAWFRREFEVPASWAGKELELSLGTLDDFDTTWVNGELVGHVYRPDRDRHYQVPASVIRPGKNALTIRVLDTGGPGGLMSPAERLSIAPVGAAESERIALAGEWQVRESLSLAGLNSRPPPPSDGNNPNVSTLLFNGMIAPLLPYSIKGAIWYQGESNADRAQQYRRLLPAMIADWRHHFGAGNFPFYIVQLAAWQAVHPEPRDHPWAELREAQAMTASTVKNCGLAVAIDVGDADDIHPKDKKTVGERLALNALAKTYGRKLEYSGPTFRSMKVKGNVARLKFDHADGGLITRGDKVTGFAVAGEDRKFVWAEVQLDGTSVVLTAPSVSKIAAVRYAWDINPVCNLYNHAGLPAVPFRTDDWPPVR